MNERFSRLKNWKSLVALILTGSAVISQLSNLDFVVGITSNPRAKAVWAFITSGMGLTITGIIWLSYLLLRPDKKNTEMTLAQRRESCPEQWLHKLAEDQKRALDSFVTIEIRSGDISIEDISIDFRFTLYNKSVYTVYLQDTLKGWAKFAGRPLQGHRKITERVVPQFVTGMEQQFKVRYFLTQDDVMWFTKKDDSEKFQFDELVFLINIPGSEPVEKNAYGFLTKEEKLIL